MQPQFEQTQTQMLFELIRRHPLATFVTQHEGQIVVNHLPLLLAVSDGDSLLRGHIPKANAIWRQFSEQEAVAVFHGPEAYVSPSWYPSKREHGKVVPTWNYVVVHARGCPVAVHDRDWLFAHLNGLTDQQESSQEHPWRVSDAPQDFTHQMADRLVGIEMPISSVTGKWKVSQNRSVEDRLGVAAGLDTVADRNSPDMRALMLQSVAESQSGS